MCGEEEDQGDDADVRTMTLLFISNFDVLSMREAKGDHNRTISLSIQTNINTVSVPSESFLRRFHLERLNSAVSRSLQALSSMMNTFPQYKKGTQELVTASERRRCRIIRCRELLQRHHSVLCH